MDVIDAVKELGVAILTPVDHRWQADGRDAVVPQYVHVGLALDEHHVADGAGVTDTVQAVEARLAAGFPAEAVAVQGNTEAHGKFFATRPEVRNAHRRSAGQDHV